MSTRLNSNHRSTLTALADKIVDVPAEAKAEEVAYQKAAPLVRALVEAEFPPKEMAILLKHEVARRDRCINVQGETAGVERFEFRKVSETDDDDENGNQDHPLVPNRPDYSCRNRIYIANAKTQTAVAAWVKAFDAKRKAYKEKIAKYHSFIAYAATYEQVLETWPEAEQVRDRIVQNLPMALSNEDLNAIKADSARRLKSVG